MAKSLLKKAKRSKLFTETDLGTCSKVLITKETTTFIGGEGNTKEGIKALKEQALDLKGMTWLGLNQE